MPCSVVKHSGSGQNTQEVGRNTRLRLGSWLRLVFFPTLLSCFSRFLRGLQQNRTQSRLLYLLISLVFVYSTDRWEKQNTSPVCFGAKDNQYGRFYVTGSYRKLAAVKLVHLYGYVSCYTRYVSHWSYWGCGSYRGALGKINVVITTSGNHVLLPPRQFIARAGSKWFQVPGYNSLSPELVLSFFSPSRVNRRQELRVWYGEDLMNTSEGDNGGTACVDVYAIFVWAFTEQQIVVTKLFMAF